MRKTQALSGLIEVRERATLSSMRIAIQGQEGSFHDLVAHQWFGSSAEPISCATFAEVFDAYETGDADAIVVAVENSIYGSINEVYQLIEACSAPIVGELKLEIDQMLIGINGTDVKKLQQIYSHPVALAQCRETLRRLAPDAELIEYFDTAGAVEYIQELANPLAAAIASEQAARLYGLPVLHRSVQDSSHNITRFLILEDRDSDADANRSSLVITTNHQPGALVEVLQVFARAGVNLAKLQSQPIVGDPWHYKFFLVVDSAGEPLRRLAAEIEQSDHQVTLLGEYRAG